MLGVCLSSPSAFAWDGVDADTGEAVEIGKGNLVREGKTIEVYDFGSGEYRDFDVEAIRRNGSSVEIDVYDSTTGATRTLEMDD